MLLPAATPSNMPCTSLMFDLFRTDSHLPLPARPSVGIFSRIFSTGRNVPSSKRRRISCPEAVVYYISVRVCTELTVPPLVIVIRPSFQHLTAVALVIKQTAGGTGPVYLTPPSLTPGTIDAWQNQLSNEATPTSKNPARTRPKNIQCEWIAWQLGRAISSGF